MDDGTLAARAATGDQAAFTALIERYRRYIYTIAYKIALNEDDALDITQNVYARLVERIGDYEGRGSFKSWLAVMTSREAISFLRRSSRREEPTAPEIIEDLAMELTASASIDVRAALDVEQRRRLVEQAMKSLSPQQRAIVALRLGEDIGPKEIAQRLDLPASQVRSQLNRAIERIKKILAEEISDKHD